MTNNDVVVGVDGSAPSHEALLWAAREASRRQVPLRVMSAYHFIVAGAYAPIGAEVAQQAEGAAKLIVDDAVAGAKAVVADLEVSGETVLGPPSLVLIEAGKSAGLLVVGSRGHGGFAAALIGATGQQVATHAPCPVVVVRGRGDTAIGPVVVGADGSASAEYALDLAYQQAEARACALTAVRVVEGSAPGAHERVQSELAETLAARPHPGVTTEQLVAGGNTAHVLVELSRGAQLVVVGTRGHGGFAGLLLGSVGLHLVHHADCPVLIARKPDPR
jgi:nucleotide-binding universal stress UspA family protein